jgi:hypothetical protein
MDGRTYGPIDQRTDRQVVRKVNDLSDKIRHKERFCALLLLLPLLKV